MKTMCRSFLVVLGLMSVRSALGGVTGRPGPHCEYGNQVIAAHERFFKGDCESCVCEMYGSGTGVNCEYMPCPPALCSDAIYTLNSCCPVCLGGATCKVGDLTISAGSYHTINATSTCHCSVKDGKWDEAVCQHGAPRRI